MLAWASVMQTLDATRTWALPGPESQLRTLAPIGDAREAVLSGLPLPDRYEDLGHLVHSRAVGRLARTLRRALGDEVWVLEEKPVRAGEHALPVPDLAVVPAPLPEDRHPRADEAVEALLS